MIAKIMKGTSFVGCVRYVLNEEKAEPLKFHNLPDGDHLQIASDFELQSQLNPKVSKKVVHIALAFSPNDDRLVDDDELMVKIAEEYMERLGIKNTQYLIARHTDREHPHCHIIYNRVDNDGRTISDKNDRFRSEKVCKMLTARHRLHFADGKDEVNKEQLQGADAKKYYILNSVQGSMRLCKSWSQLEMLLKAQGIDMIFKCRSGTLEPQGIKFRYDGTTFSGSKVDRSLSYSRIDSYFEYKNNLEMAQQRAEEAAPQEQSISESVVSGALSIFSPLDSGGGYDEDEEAAQQQQKLKKKRKGMRM